MAQGGGLSEETDAVDVISFPCVWNAGSSIVQVAVQITIQRLSDLDSDY